MKILRPTCNVLFCITLYILHSPWASGLEPELESRFFAAIKNYEAVTPAVIADPANKDLVKALKEEALTKQTPGAVIPLINAGDTDVIKDCLATFHNPKRRVTIAWQLERCAQPKLIYAVGDDLNLQENADPIRHEDLLTEHQSTAAAHLICALITNSQEFPGPTRAWATGLDNDYILDKTKFRAEIRTWWDQNKALLQAEQFKHIKPPADLQ